MAKNDETLIFIAAITCLLAVALLFFGQGLELIGQAVSSIGQGLIFLALAVLFAVLVSQRKGR